MVTRFHFNLENLAPKIREPNGLTVIIKFSFNLTIKWVKWVRYGLPVFIVDCVFDSFINQVNEDCASTYKHSILT